MSKWSRTLALLMAVLMLIVSGCTSAPAQSDTDGSKSDAPSQSDSTPDPVTLNLWIMPNTSQSEQDMLEVIKPFTDANPHVTVKVTVLDWGAAMPKITAAATSGEGPDLLQLGTTWTPAVAAMGALEPLNIDEFGGKDAYWPASLATTQILGQPEYYAIPWFVDLRAIYYRTDVFEKAGVDPEEAFKTWDTFKEALHQVNGTEIDGKPLPAIGFPGKNDWNVLHFIFPWIWGAGGSELTPDNTKSAINTEEALDGLMFYTGLVREGLAPVSYLEKNTADVESAFHNGEFAVFIDGPWLVRSYYTPSDKGGHADSIVAKNYGVAPMPEGPAGRYTFFGGSNMSVWKNSKHKKEALELLKFLMSEEGQMAYARFTGNIPGVKAAADDMVALDPHYEGFLEAAKSGRSYPSIPAWMTSEPIYQMHFGNIWDIVAGVSGTYSRDAIKKELEALEKDINAHLKANM